MKRALIDGWTMAANDWLEIAESGLKLLVIWVRHNQVSWSILQTLRSLGGSTNSFVNKQMRLFFKIFEALPLLKI